MKPADLAGIHDILPLPPEPRGGWLLAIGAALAAAALLWFGRRWLHPLARLERALRQGRIGTRQAAHRLARLNHRPHLTAEIDRLRFGRRPPDRRALQTLIARCRD